MTADTLKALKASIAHWRRLDGLLAPLPCGIKSAKQAPFAFFGGHLALTKYNQAASTLDRIPLYWIQVLGGGEDWWYLCPEGTFEIYATWHR